MQQNLPFDLTDPKLFDDGVPHPIFDEVRERYPVYGQPNPLGGTVWSLTRHADIRRVSADVATFSSTGGLVYPNHPMRTEVVKDHMMFKDPPDHTRLRAFAAKAFSPAVVARFESWVRELCVKLVDKVCALDGEFDALHHIAASLPSQVIASILGVPEEDRAELVHKVLMAVAEYDPAVGREGSVEAIQWVIDYTFRLRDLKHREPGVDMATQLAMPDPSGSAPLNDSEYSSMMTALINAGFETTNTLIGQGLLLMAQNEDVSAALRTTDRKILSRSLDELLRYITPAMYFGRTVTRDTELHGQHLKNGDFVIMWFVAGNRDPAVFEDPHRFNANRPRNPHIAFGAGGPHFCIGSHLAKLEAELLFAELAERGIKLALAGKPRRLPGNFINGLRGLQMRRAS